MEIYLIIAKSIKETNIIREMINKFAGRKQKIMREEKRIEGEKKR